MKTVLVTGATGFIGSALTTRLVALGYRVVALTRNAEMAKRPGYTHGDLRDRNQVCKIVAEVKPHFVFHLAADNTRVAGSPQDLRQSIDMNVTATHNLVEACSENSRLERFVFLGTCEEYGAGVSPFKELQREMPISPYSFSKVVGTHLLQLFYKLHKFPCVMLRPTLAYGPGQASDMFLPALIRSLMENRLFEASPGYQTRDYIFVEDLVDACLAAIQADALGNIINIGSGCSIPLRDIALIAARMVGANAEDLLRFGVLPYRPNEIMDYSADIALARELLGWSPRISLEEGIRKTIESYRNGN